MGNNMTNENNTSTNCKTNITSQNMLSVSGDSRARSSSVSGLSSNNRLGSTFNLVRQQSIGSQVDLSINDRENITEKDLVKLYDRINEISKDNFLMSIDEIIQELQKDQKDIASILIDRFLSQEWDTRSDDGHSLLTIAIQRGDKDNINYLLGYMKEELTLHDAAKQGKSEPLKIIVNFLKNQLKLGREINKKDRYGKTPLHCAAQSGSQECFQLLLTEGARFSDDIYNRSELHFVAQSGNIKCLDYLRDKFKKNGIFQFENEIHKKDKYGNNLLHYAAKSGNKECIERIIGDHIAFIENNNGDTPLHHIASIETIEDKEKHGEAMAFLIEKMAAMLMTDAFFVINQTNRLGYTPLHLAAINDNTACIKVLIERGAKIDAKNVIDGSNALHYAIMYGHSETAKKLLSLNANKNIRHEDDRVLVHLAAMSGNKDCLEFIIEKFPEDINTTDGSDNTLLHLAAQFGNKECLELLAEKMKSKGINLSEEIFKKNNNGETAMHSAALSGNVECLEYLIEIIKQKKYDIKKNIKDVLTQQDENGEVLLHSAVLSGNVECFNLTIKTMEEANIDIKSVIRSKNNKKKNLLHLAALSGNKECASVLIELIKEQCNIVDQDLCYLIEKDIDGNSIFHMTAISGNKECIEYFTEKTKLVLDINLLYPRPPAKR